MTGSVFLNRKFYAQFCVFGEYWASVQLYEHF